MVVEAAVAQMKSLAVFNADGNDLTGDAPCCQPVHGPHRFWLAPARPHRARVPAQTAGRPSRPPLPRANACAPPPRRRRRRAVHVWGEPCDDDGAAGSDAENRRACRDHLRGFCVTLPQARSVSLDEAPTVTLPCSPHPASRACQTQRHLFLSLSLSHSLLPIHPPSLAPLFLAQSLTLIHPHPAHLN